MNELCPEVPVGKGPQMSVYMSSNKLELLVTTLLFSFVITIKGLIDHKYMIKFL